MRNGCSSWAVFPGVQENRGISETFQLFKDLIRLDMVKVFPIEI